MPLRGGHCSVGAGASEGQRDGAGSVRVEKLQQLLLQDKTVPAGVKKTC